MSLDAWRTHGRRLRRRRAVFTTRPTAAGRTLRGLRRRGGGLRLGGAAVAAGEELWRKQGVLGVPRFGGLNEERMKGGLSFFGDHVSWPFL